MLPIKKVNKTNFPLQNDAFSVLNDRGDYCLHCEYNNHPDMI